MLARPAPVPLRSLAWALALAVAAGGCSDDIASVDTGGEPGGSLADQCSLSTGLLAAGGPPPDGIPALVTPRMVPAFDPESDYLRPEDRVLGVVFEGQARAYPHNILWWHEIVNDTAAGRSFAVTYCPLTGSGLVFDKGSADWTGVDLGVSGLLFANNLLMYDRVTGRLIGPQMSVRGRCGDFDGVEPDLLPVVETTWGRWTQLHGNTLVVSEATGWGRNYRQYPYVDGGVRYDALTHAQVYFPQSVDRSRPIKELVLGVRTGATSGVGYPFGELAALGRAGALDDEVGDLPVAVFWEAGIDATGGTAVAYDRRVDGRTLSFHHADGWVRDRETESRWTLGGRALDGPLQGTQLRQVEDAYVAFWFAWKHFQPDGRVFEAP